MPVNRPLTFDWWIFNTSMWVISLLRGMAIGFWWRKVWDGISKTFWFMLSTRSFWMSYKDRMDNIPFPELKTIYPVLRSLWAISSAFFVMENGVKESTLMLIFFNEVMTLALPSLKFKYRLYPFSRQIIVWKPFRSMNTLLILILYFPLSLIIFLAMKLLPKLSIRSIDLNYCYWLILHL